MSSVQTSVDTIATARFREQWLKEAGVPYGGWMAVHRVIGTEGSPLARCTCKQGYACERPGKHPVTSRFPNGSRDSASLEEVTDYLGTFAGAGGRLAAVLAPEAGERVLDADRAAGLATLHRCGEEVEAGWLHVLTPRGMHVWQWGAVAKGYGGSKRRNRCRPPVGLDVKINGFVIWPDGRGRWAVDIAWAREWLGRRYPGIAAGEELIAGPTARQAVRPQDRELQPLVASAGLWTDEGTLHGEAKAVVLAAAEGERNNALNYAAWRCRALIAYANWPVDEVADSLYRVGREVGLEHGETERTVRSGLGIERGQWYGRGSR